MSSNVRKCGYSIIQYDKVPLPGNTNVAAQSVIKQLSEKPSNQCR